MKGILIVPGVAMFRIKLIVCHLQDRATMRKDLKFRNLALTIQHENDHHHHDAETGTSDAVASSS